MNRNLLMTVGTGVLIATGALAHAQSYTPRPAVQDAANPQSDQQITERVKGKLATDEPNIAPHIAVTTHDGVVTLEGIAMTPNYILKALFDAESIDGVVHVNNRLTVD
jgi:osmotically-inducible protein OsmY